VNDPDIVPGCLVRRKVTALPYVPAISLWKTTENSSFVIAVAGDMVGLVLARHVDPNANKGIAWTDQVMVLFGHQFGWTSTQLFERVETV
jgi:hypothetical protein